MLSPCGAVVIWSGFSTLTSAQGNFAQIYDASGNVVQSEFLVNTPDLHSALPDVTSLADGGFLAVWEDRSGLDGEGTGIFAQRYENNSYQQK